ncbi:MAG: class I SAM-dependent methyltransferase [Gemmatimonadaceae bacterium]
MRRLHGIELLDIPRCPRVIRDGATDYLQFIIRTGNAYEPIVPILAQALANRGISEIVDLCSGGGGPWPDLRKCLVENGATAELRVHLTDLYPNVEAFANVAECDALVSGAREALDIERYSIPMHGLRTFFSSFHHFTPSVAREVLRNAARNGDGILIAEVTGRRASAMLFMLLAPLLVWLATPRLRPFRWSRLFFTYVIPAIPFVVCYDGIVSCFRTYSVDELRALLTTVEDLPYEWQLGLASGHGLLPVTYALGFPTSRAVSLRGSDA